MRFLAKIVLGLVVLVVLVVGGLAVAVSTMDINQYREEIATALSKQLGRTVKFGGPIKLAISSHGFALAISDAAIGNPAWASRDQMAGIGSLKLGVALMPLLNKEIVVTELDIGKADILLETGANNQHNWEMKAATAPGKDKAEDQPVETTKASPSAPPVGVRVDRLSIVDSQLAMRDKTGKISTMKVEKMTLAPEGRGLAISFDGSYDGTPIKASLKTETTDLMAAEKWPFNADVSYDKFNVSAAGITSLASKMADIAKYEITSGGSTLRGQMKVNFGGARTSVNGTVTSDKIDMADFKSDQAAAPAPEAAPAEASKQPEGAKPMFSREPLNVSALRTADVNIDMTVGELVLGKATLKQVSSKIALNNSILVLGPFKGMLGDSNLSGNVRLDAAASPQYKIDFKAPGVDIAGLLEMMGTKPFISGKGEADIDLSGFGASLHDMASTTEGRINVTAAGGQVSSSEANGIGAGLAQVFAPGAGNPTLNCMATRFVVSKGVARDNGILADSSASTVAGAGGFDLGQETLALTFNAKPKVVNTRGLTPAVSVSGSLTAPHIGIDAAGSIGSAAGMLAKDSKIGGILGGVLGGGATGEGAVPTMAQAPAGENACIYTLDHKSAAAAAAPAEQNSGVKGVVGQGTTKAKDMGKQLIQGIFGH